MLEILEVPGVRRQVRPIDVRTYHRMTAQGLVGKHTELLRGVIVDKMSKSPLHEFIAGELFRLLSANVGEGFTVRKEGPLTLKDSEPEPDLAVVRGKPAEYRQAHPGSAEFVIEIAVSSTDLDREKATLYAEAEVPELWLVVPEQAHLEVHTEPRAGKYTRAVVFGAEDTVTSLRFPRVQIHLRTLFAG